MTTRRPLLFLLLPCLLGALVPREAAAQNLKDVLSFLLTNRSIMTGDFERDEAAAAATRDAMTALLQAELGTLPSSSSSAGFTYRLDPTLGANIRSTDSFGPFFAERALTSGAGQAFFSVSYSHSEYRTIDGRSLTKGTLVSTASKLHDEAQFFDIETLTLKMRADLLSLQASYGATDRLDIGAVLPVLRITMDGERVDTYRGTRNVQATASGTATGIGDGLLRAKYNVLRAGADGIAVALDVRVPTGSSGNLLGTGDLTFEPRLILSLDNGRAGASANLGYLFGASSPEVDANAAATFAVTPRLTLVAEGLGRRLASLGTLTQVVAPHPRLLNVDTVRLTASDESTVRIEAIGGVKWNFSSTWTLSAQVQRPLTSAGLNAGWTPTISLDRSIAP